MNTDRAVELAGGRQELADLLGVHWLSTYRWKPDLPPMREYQLRFLRPGWFKPIGGRGRPRKAAAR